MHHGAHSAPYGSGMNQSATPSLADAILDRLVHNAHKLDLSGESIRKSKRGLTKPANQE
jgi:DNA replication protein DnaC